MPASSQSVPRWTSNFLSEINGSDGSVVMTGSSGHLQYGRVQVQTAATGDRFLATRNVPSEYEAIAHDRDQLSYTVAQAYARLAIDLREGTESVPCFADAVVRHRALDAVQRSASTGERVAYDASPATRH